MKGEEASGDRHITLMSKLGQSSFSISYHRTVVLWLDDVAPIMKFLGSDAYQ